MNASTSATGRGFNNTCNVLLMGRKWLTALTWLVCVRDNMH